MKTTLDISDNLLLRAKQKARQEKTTLRSLVEDGLSRVLDESERLVAVKVTPVTFAGDGLQAGMRGASWGEILNLAYEGRGS